MMQMVIYHRQFFRHFCSLCAQFVQDTFYFKCFIVSQALYPVSHLHDCHRLHVDCLAALRHIMDNPVELGTVFDFNRDDVSVISHCNRSEEHTSELQSRGHLVCRLLLEKKKYKTTKDPC